MRSSPHLKLTKLGLGDKLAPHWNANKLIVVENSFQTNKQNTCLKENGIEHQMSMPDSPQQNGWAERFQQTIVNGAEAMQHHAGLATGFWIHTVKVKVHTYNITPIIRAGYKTPTELFKGVKPNISHLQVFGCQAWVHILKKRRSKLEPKSQEMIYVSYKLGSKGYQFWDAAHQCFKISHDVKFEESIFLQKKSHWHHWVTTNFSPGQMMIQTLN